MASISGFGIKSLALIAACTTLIAPLTQGQAADGQLLDVKITGLRNSKGVMRVCIAPRGGKFPDCSGPGAQSGTTVIVNGVAQFRFAALPKGEFAVAVFHDENKSGKLDTFLGMPKEGYGFSRNPGFRPRAPRFDEAAISVTQNSAITIKLRYLL